MVQGVWKLSELKKKDTNLADPLNLDFQPLELWENQLLLFKPPSLVLCYGCPTSDSGLVPQSLSLGHTPPPNAYPSLIFPVPLSQGLVSFDCELILYIHFSEANSQNLWIAQLLNSSLRWYCGFCLPVVLLLGNLPSLIPCISSRTVGHNICLLSIEHPSGPSFFFF